MKRRSFLAMLGLAPVAAAAAAKQVGGKPSGPVVTAPIRRAPDSPVNFEAGQCRIGEIHFSELRSRDGNLVMRPGIIEIPGIVEIRY